MNWTTEAKDELREYEAKRLAVVGIPDEIKQLKEQMKKLRGSGNATPVKGGSSPWEDRQINLIVRIEKLETSLLTARNWVKKVECGLAALSPEERLILDRFYVHAAKGNLERLCDELCLEKTAVYRRKDDALRHYTLARYGCTEV